MQKATFGQLLRDLRRSKNISQRGLADRAGVDFSYISKVENDRLSPPAAETVIRIAEALGMPSEVLLSHSGKVSSDLKNTMSSSPDAIRFLNEASSMKLKDEEWQFLFGELKKLR